MTPGDDWPSTSEADKQQQPVTSNKSILRVKPLRRVAEWARQIRRRL